MLYLLHFLSEEFPLIFLMIFIDAHAKIFVLQSPRYDHNTYPNLICVLLDSQLLMTDFARDVAELSET